MTIVICEHELPIPTDKLEEEDELMFSLVKWDEVEFHSFNMPIATVDNFMDFVGGDKVTISEDGLIYRHLIEENYQEDDNGLLNVTVSENGIERDEYTGEIVFGTLFKGKKYDYWIEFKTLFWKGDLKEVELANYEKKSNAPRLEAKEKLMEAINEMAKPPERKNLLVRCFGWLAYVLVSPLCFVFSKIYINLSRLDLWIRNLKK
tara:strand:+ start:54620 stop:55234 length:615 start_codon:yes stop_codon:yes gene_type:complete